MLLIGLTGNIASGKSTVSREFAARGATVIDADLLARQAVREGTAAYDEIVRRWGEGVVSPDGVLDRGALRRIVFEDPAQLEELNGFVHPEVVRLRNQLLDEARARGDRIVVYDVPLLFERHLVDEFDAIVLVDAPRPMRLERLVRDRGLRETEAMDMIAAQMPAELKRARADFVIDNDDTREALGVRVREVWQAIEDLADARARGDSTTPDAPAARPRRAVKIP